MKHTLTTCGLCGCGCALYVEAAGRRVRGLCPSSTHPVSTGRLCIKGWNGTADLINSERLTTPLIRNGDRLEPASWEQAVSLIAHRLRAIISEHGAHRVGVIGSTRTTNEECYALVKFARSVLGTPNVDGASRFYDASAIYGLLETTGIPASDVEINALREAGSILAVGANVMEQMPHIGSRIEDAALGGGKVVAIDPRESRISAHTSLFLQPKPGTDLALARSMLKLILDQGLYMESAPETAGFEELRTSLEGASLEDARRVCGLEPGSVEEAVRIIAQNPPLVVMFGLGVLQQESSTELVRALADIAILLGGRVMPLRPGNNAQGAADLGLLHDFLPGYGRLTDPVARKVWEAMWSCQLPSDPGMSAPEMIRGCGSRELKGLLVFGDNLALSAPNTEESLAALSEADFLVVADLYLTETARLADVVLPACSFLEKEGTFTNVERRVQRVRKVLEPVGESRPDLDIIADISAAMGTEIARDPARIMAEIASGVPFYRDMQYEKLAETWDRRCSANGTVRKLKPVGKAEYEDDFEYPFRVIASRIVFPQATGTMSSHSRILAREYADAFAEINRSDAERLGIKPGRRITITSRTGSLTRTVLFNEGIPAGCVHLPHFFGGDSANMLTGHETDPESGVPVFKGIAVKVEAV